ncbi:GyrI-like domain-containing protein [Salinibacterium hongtaonis]|uniref:AraC family transcriptional regulator n=1 Tax=Homoserinimonas hongtaonis TaxID=2079791 RepID=A0A2U1SX29_9MICO|nr:GyrI-like domain-containing protein [Salinibacterium hongtaonis]PWB96156.1 AraC family transcriptional regulator [Salinibacterium hongtaonis]
MQQESDEVGPKIVEVPPTLVGVIHDVVPMNQMVSFFDRVFATVPQVLAKQDVAIVGPAVAVYFGAPGETADIAAGFPIASEIDPAEGVTSLWLPTGQAVTALHIGSYDGLADAYSRLLEWMTERSLTPAQVMWESYVTMPTPEADPADMRTVITWLLQD